MKVAIDKNCIDKIKDFEEFEYVYIFKDELLSDLLKIDLECVHKDYAKDIDIDIDINLTDYKIDCLEKRNIKDKNWKKPIELPNYKYSIIVPNYNNDHRRI